MEKVVKTGFLKSGTFTKKKYIFMFVSCLLAWVVSLIDSCADLFIAGIFLDDTAVSAISLVEPVCSVITFLAYLVSVGTVVLYSKENGAGNKEKSYKIVGQGFIVSLIISALLVVGLIIAKEPFLDFYGASDQIRAMAEDYYTVEIVFAAIYPVYYLIFQLIGVEGDGKIAFLACLFGAVTNIGSSLFFILNLNLGVKGLAYGTIVGTVIAVLIYCIHFFKKDNAVRLKFYFNFKDIWETIKISSSTAVTFVYVAIVDIVMNKAVILNFGEKYLPAYAVINFILNFAAMFGAFNDSSSGFLSVAMGEKNPASIRRTMKINYKVGAVISFITIIIFEIIAPYIPAYFGIEDPEVFAASVYAIRVISLAFPATALIYVFSSYYPLSGHVIYGHIVSGLYMLITPVVIAVPLGALFGFNGLSWGFMLTSVVAFGVTELIILFKHGKKAFPLMLEETDEENFTYDFYLSPENITNLCIKIKENLESKNVSSKIINEVQLILEESYMTILEKNKKKKVCSECDLLISKNRIRLFTRDNGVIFDITDADQKVINYRTYVLGLLMQRNLERQNSTTVSFNRNEYVWDLNNETKKG